MGGSNLPERRSTGRFIKIPKWYQRGAWGPTGHFFSDETTIKRHLLQLCHDYDFTIDPVWGVIRIVQKPAKPDFGRLKHLRVGIVTINDSREETVSANQFIRPKIHAKSRRTSTKNRRK